ncbi:nucleoside-diphosphate sugar epimerase/dehydratase [Demetria terragena]|uniref:nucleoside-diphosphate sugar epimerase/dehydratase n=1 Tax=Demetria terragena TaxID=63959 RepID=UPI0003771543|nr:nucleoside-diphosphate sugar epimerase/dehydratase [Demetria terragena]
MSREFALTRVIRSRGRLPGMDAFVWLASLAGAVWLRYDFDISRLGSVALPWFILGAIVMQIVLGSVLGPYSRGHQRGSFEETLDVVRTASIVGLTLIIINFIIGTPLPRSVPFIAMVLAIGGMFAARFVKRSWDLRRATNSEGAQAAIILGAGEAGRRLARSMLRDDNSGYLPVAFLDDDQHKRKMRIEGVRVRGTRDLMASLAEETGATVLVVAVPKMDAAELREVSQLATEANLRVLTIPPVRDLLDGTSGGVKDLRDVDLTELLGRRPVDLDSTLVSGQLNSRRVLVTGAGGSIGSELCRQIARFGPAKLYLLDRDESGLQATQMTLVGNGLLDNDEVVLADIRDPRTLNELFDRLQPEVVFHAAALKHLPLLEKYPSEAWQSNVLGTLNILSAAARVNVKTFVNISTDKAANPTCNLGYSKRLAERLTADFAQREEGRYVSVRFGNVLGSRGSVVHAFTAQIERGGPVTVTHPDVERYFMLIPEACQLVLEASSIGEDGEVMVLDMGDPMKIVDVAKSLIRHSGKDVEIAFTGLRPGEKLSEELFSPFEQRRTTDRDWVDSVDVPSLDPLTVTTTSHETPEAAHEWMKEHAFGGLDLSVRPGAPEVTAADSATPGDGMTAQK